MCKEIFFFFPMNQSIICLMINTEVIFTKKFKLHP